MNIAKKTGFLKLSEIYSRTVSILKATPVIFLPFIVFFILELLALIIASFYPIALLRTIFGPLVRTFWGEQFLHYPVNFLLLPTLANTSRMILAVVFGSLLSGVAVLITADIYTKKIPLFRRSLKNALKKYVALIFIILILTILMYYVLKLVDFVYLKHIFAPHPKLAKFVGGFWIGTILIGIKFFLSGLMQAAFIYTTPLIMIAEKRPLIAILESFKLFGRCWRTTFLLVLLPMFIYLPIMVLNLNNGFLIDNTFPEFLIIVTLLGAMVNSLIIDPLVTVSTTILYLHRKECA